MNEEKQKQLCLTAGLFVALAANLAAIGVTIWENNSSTDADLWFSSTFAAVWFGSTLLAFFVGLPLSVTALWFYWKQEIWLKAVLAIIGSCLSLSPWVMPVVTEWWTHR